MSGNRVNAFTCKDRGLPGLRLEDKQADSDSLLSKRCSCLEKTLAATVEELARCNRDLEQLAYAASHDLQEPLRMVVAYTQLLAQRYRGKLDENADKYIAYAVGGALRMQELIQDLLTFSRVTGNGVGRSHTDCNAALAEALHHLGTAIEESGAVITGEQLPSVHADRRQLVQLFQDLIGNAIKFRGPKAPIITLSAERQAEMTVFAVADNGIGIAAENTGRIFEMFQRLHARDEYCGNGAGLAICQRIVEHHGGRIWVESSVGAGSTFRFSLPRTSADEKPADDHEAHS